MFYAKQDMLDSNTRDLSLNKSRVAEHATVWTIEVTHWNHVSSLDRSDFSPFRPKSYMVVWLHHFNSFRCTVLGAPFGHPLLPLGTLLSVKSLNKTSSCFFNWCFLTLKNNISKSVLQHKPKNIYRILKMFWSFWGEFKVK